MIWCEEIGKYEGVFICENGSISYKNHKCGQKTCKWCKKTCRLNVEKLTKVKKNVCS